MSVSGGKRRRVSMASTVLVVRTLALAVADVGPTNRRYGAEPRRPEAGACALSCLLQSGETTPVAN